MAKTKTNGPIRPEQDALAIELLQFTLGRQQSENTFQVAFKIPEEWVKWADDIAEGQSLTGVPWTRTDALRAALVRGLEILRAETKRRASYRRLVDYTLARKTVRAGDVAGEFDISIELANSALHRLSRLGALQLVPFKGDRLPKPGEQGFRLLPNTSAEAMKILRGSGIDPDSPI
jgi:hypothetical protein